MARPREFNTIVALGLLGVLAWPRAGADEIRKWRDADGNLHYSITGAQDGSASGGEIDVMSARKPTAEERFSIEASLRRREIERRLTAAGRALTEAREELRRLEEKRFEAWVPAVTGDPRSAQASLDAQRDALLAAMQFDHEKAEALRRLRRQERQRLKQLAELWRSFAALGAEVRARYGTLPPWWRERLDCGGCPGAEEVDKALHPARPTPPPEESAAQRTDADDEEDWEEEP
ncbi:MAG: hypothetical protein HYY35_04325 [Deltaproteobacteria bacterium]|nr:hypothetical protein [Deltaproteobacteria bacterium]